MKVTEVAVAILLKPDGSFLLSSRPEGKPYAGYWEFPGGKIEPGESVHDALVRELREELAVTITRATPWFTFVMHYTHATVRLHCWRVWAWEGTLQGMEGQRFEWQSLARMTVTPTLPGCVPIFQALSLPSVYAISNAAEMGQEAYIEYLRALWSKNASKVPPILDFHNHVAPGLVQVREKNFAPLALKEFAHDVVALAHEHQAKVLINSDAALAAEVGADGVHLTAAQLAELSERPALPLVGASVHTREELERAAALKCDFAILGAVKPTRSHPGGTTLGWAQFQVMAEATPIPCYALGGLSLTDMDAAITHGAHGIALQRGL
jgi:8-oxo-dGTP diphosphatase